MWKLYALYNSRSRKHLSGNAGVVAKDNRAKNQMSGFKMWSRKDGIKGREQNGPTGWRLKWAGKSHDGLSHLFKLRRAKSRSEDAREQTNTELV